jgi:phosphoribosylanthranilate isomerase
MFVKICGITRRQDAEVAAEHGADALGFVFWRSSPRFIEPSRAREIVRSLPSSVLPVGVFVDETLQGVRSAIERSGVRCVQMHGQESPQTCGAMGLPVFKAFRVGARFDITALDPWPAEVTVLLDACDPLAPGGTGRRADWAVARTVAARRRTILAGGLTPDNVARAISVVSPYGVDVSSGVEAAPGIKDAPRLCRFIRSVRSAQTGGRAAAAT